MASSRHSEEYNKVIVMVLFHAASIDSYQPVGGKYYPVDCCEGLQRLRRDHGPFQMFRFHLGSKLNGATNDLR
jgi:hypothetical protein